MLITNGVRYGGGPMRFEGGQNAASIDRGLSMGQTPAGYLNFSHGEATVGSAAPAFGIPHGARHPATWMMGERGGGIKSYKLSGLTINATATGELGLPTTGATSITITGTCAGGLIVGATGTATISIDGTAAIVATLNATGAVTITIDGNVAMGAEASLTGTGTITIDGHADAMALGYMTGTTEEAGLTPSGIARAVWESILANYTNDGTAGKALGTASSGGVDYEALAAAILAAAQVTPIHSEVKKVATYTIGGSGTELDPWGPIP
jgi:hypothetical protein